VDSLGYVRAAELLLLAGGLLAAIFGLVVGLLLRPRAPRAARLFAEAVPEALGDAVIVLDGSDRIVHANPAAGEIAGVAPDRLVGRPIGVLGSDLTVLSRGLARGPSAGLVTLATRRGPVRARAALVRVSSRPPRDAVVLRPEPPPRPPSLPRQKPGPSVASPADVRDGVIAAAAAVKDPLERAARAASLLRLAAPPLGARAQGALAAVEQALEDAERRVGALSAAARPGAPRALDLAALVADVVEAFAPPPGVRVRAAIAPARAHADDRPLRTALREVLGAAAAALPAGDIHVSVRDAGPFPIIEVAGDGAAPLAVGGLARALLAPHGARVEEEAAGRRGWMLRIALPPAPARAMAPA
jgi:PAS domain-containing protein